MQELYEIPAGTILYRAAPNICNYTESNIHKQLRVCENTGKTGVYFSTYIFQALAMTIEYKKDLELGIFQTTAPLLVSVGKFPMSFYERYDDNPILSHINAMYPILDRENDSKYSLNLEYGEGEVFIAHPAWLQYIVLIDTYTIHYKELERYIKSVDSLSLRNTTEYLKEPIVTKISCKRLNSPNKTKKTRRRK